MAGEHLTFFELELVQLSSDVLEAFYAKDPFVAKHRPWIEHVRLFKPHFLSEPVESALMKRSPFYAHAWSEFFDETEADLEFDFQTWTDGQSNFEMGQVQVNAPIDVAKFAKPSP